MHQGYIDWERFEANQRRLADNARAFGGERRLGPAREGPALLQGRVLCGLCGERMSVRYGHEHGCTVPTYVCQETAVRRAGKTCQTVPGKIVDAAVATLLIEMMTPMTLAVTLEVQRELEARAAETDAARRQHVERMRYEAELARRRYMKVDPDNRLVADALEAEWNDKLRSHTDALADYERRSRDQVAALDEQARRRLRARGGVRLAGVRRRAGADHRRAACVGHRPRGVCRRRDPGIGRPGRFRQPPARPASIRPHRPRDPQGRTGPRGEHGGFHATRT
jgi:hypothetical protein